MSFCLDREGRVLDVRIERSSGSDALDREALASLRRASPAPAPPSNSSGTALQFRSGSHRRRLIDCREWENWNLAPIC